MIQPATVAVGLAVGLTLALALTLPQPLTRSDWGKALQHGGFERFLMKMDDDGILVVS